MTAPNSMESSCYAAVLDGLHKQLHDLVRSSLSRLERSQLQGHGGGHGARIRIDASLQLGEGDVEQITLANIELSAFLDHANKQQVTAYNTSTPQSLSHDDADDICHSHSHPHSHLEAVEHEDPGPPLPLPSPRRKHTSTGGLRLQGRVTKSTGTEKTRRLNTDSRSFPQRRKQNDNVRKMEPSSLEKLIRSIWEQIHGSLSFDLKHVIDQWIEVQRGNPARITTTGGQDVDMSVNHRIPAHNLSFRRMNVFCQRMTQASKSCRALEVIVQAQWVQSFDERAQTLARENRARTTTDCRMQALGEACEDFGWTEKDLRNKLAIWRGYREIQEAGGWVALVFAGMGLYRFCKYRMGFTEQNMSILRAMRQRFEVAADTMHPRWRQMLSIVGEQNLDPVYHGHAHDWVVSRDQSPVPLASTYLQWTPCFTFEHLDSSIIDRTKWGGDDPREMLKAVTNSEGFYLCDRCRKVQSEEAENQCRCFPDLFGSGRRRFCPVQVFRTDDVRNNGLLSCASFERGNGIGEFVGLITTGISDLDVMQGSTDTGASYQIYQGAQGNYTRFINHSCTPNSQFERFTWLGGQRIVLVSKGIEEGCEVTVDYSEEYWANLDKECLCGASHCRYTNRMAREG